MSSAERFRQEYTIDDYRHWEGRWELLDGFPVAMTPSPFGRHASVLMRIGAAFLNSIQATNCDATVVGELDWIVSVNTVVRPDAMVLCGAPPEQHLHSTPEIAIEILSDSTRDRDLNFKRELYEREGVAFYLIVDADKKSVQLLQLIEKQYVEINIEPKPQLTICDGCQLTIDFQRFFD